MIIHRHSLSCTHTYIYPHTHAYINHTFIHALCTYIHTYSYIHIYILSYICLQIDTHSLVRIHIYPHTHAYIHHTLVHTYISTHPNDRCSSVRELMAQNKFVFFCRSHPHRKQDVRMVACCRRGWSKTLELVDGDEQHCEADIVVDWGGVEGAGCLCAVAHG